MKIYSCILFVFSFINNSFSQITFQKTFEIGIVSELIAVKQTNDSGYIFTGRAFSNSTGSEDYFLIKTDINGDTVWTRTIGGIETDQAQDIIQTFDGGYLIVGGSLHTLLIKTNSNGDTLWTKSFGNTNASFSVIQTFDSNFVFESSQNFSGVLLCKINNDGDTLWTRLIDDIPSTFATCIKQTSDSGLIIVGSIGGVTPNDNDVYLLKTNSSGVPLWAKAYGVSTFDRGFSVVQTFDNGFLILAQYDSLGVSHINLIRTDEFGNIFWTKSYKGSRQEQQSSIRITKDGNYIISGRMYMETTANIYLIKIDTIGEIIWEKAFTGNGFTLGGCIDLTYDGGFIIVGYTQNPDFFLGRYSYIIKADSSGYSGCNEIIPNFIEQNITTSVRSIVPLTSATNIPIVHQDLFISNDGLIINKFCFTSFNGIENEIIIQPFIYPNPVSNSFTISLNENMENASIKIFNSLGQNIYSTFANGNNKIINTLLVDGIYYLELVNKNKRYIQKILKN